MARRARVSLLVLALFLTLQLQSTPASAAPKSCLVLSQDETSVLLALVAGLTSNFRTLYVFPAIRGIALQIDDGLLPALQKLPGVIDVIPDRLYNVHTTRSWEFLKLESGGNPKYEWQYGANFGKGVIIANVDSGVSPTSRSFRNDGVVDFPLGWRGICQASSNKTYGCNKKLIGARYFNEGIKASNFLDGGSQLDPTDLNSPWDYNGHGSHTLSTAGGGFVDGASAFGRGTGTAKGGSPSARVASYKACYAVGCSGLDILAAIVAAVEDGVHVLSLSIGAPPADYVADLMAIGTLYAVQKGVAVVASAGNSGPVPGSVTNLAPWIFTVGASTMDRDFPAYVIFGDKTIEGQSLSSSTEPAGHLYPMVSGEKANAAGQSADTSTQCLPGSLDPAKVEGKIVVCTGVHGRAAKGLAVKKAGGVGMVLCSDASGGLNGVLADPHLIPTSHCSYSQCRDLFQYLSTTTSPVGYIMTAKDAKVDVVPAPTMAFFSSRGPNTITPQILKPDITAPGVSVIAAFSVEVSPTDLASDDRRVPYNVESGTSMSCPHVAGIVGLVKNKYRNWSPPMMKSAIMTTASTVANDYTQIEDENGASATPFSCGSGHVDPISALDPGLVYDTTEFDYANFLCSLRPTQPESLLPIQVPALLPAPLPALLRWFIILAGANFNANPFQCSLGAYRPEDLNYPSISAACLSASSITTVRRRVKNVVDVGPWPAYKVSVVQPTAGVRITVQPTTLIFTRSGEEKEFKVKLEVYDAAAAANYVFGSIEWTDGKHRVRSPVVATTKCA